MSMEGYYVRLPDDQRNELPRVTVRQPNAARFETLHPQDVSGSAERLEAQTRGSLVNRTLPLLPEVREERDSFQMSSSSTKQECELPREVPFPDPQRRVERPSSWRALEGHAHFREHDSIFEILGNEGQVIDASLDAHLPGLQVPQCQRANTLTSLATPSPRTEASPTNPSEPMTRRISSMSEVEAMYRLKRGLTGVTSSSASAPETCPEEAAIRLKGVLTPSNDDDSSTRMRRTLTSIKDKIMPCTQHKFFEKYELEGTAVFSLVESACMDQTREPAEYLDPMLLVADQEDNKEAWGAQYKSFGPFAIKIHAIHFAASRGSIPVMQWILGRFGSDILDHRALLIDKKKGTEIEHYTPLMSAMFMSQTEGVIWLLDEGVDVTLWNSDGLTALHLFAWNGFPHEHFDVRLSALERVSAKLIEKSADLDKCSGKITHRNDPEAALLRNRTPLQIAAEKKSAYPKQMLHLLTSSFQTPARGGLFKELHIVAKANPNAAELLLDRIRKDYGPKRKELLRQEIMDKMKEEELHDKKDARGKKGETFLVMFMTILKKSPIAGSELLKLLMFEPEVNDPQRYPLPLFTMLPNRIMLCTYQPCVHPETKLPLWDATKPHPEWHNEFCKEIPDDPLLQENTYEVNVRYLHMPGILNVRILSILSMLWPYWDHMKIFAHLPVQALITCMWLQCCSTFYFVLAWEMLLLFVLLCLGVFHPWDEYPSVMKVFRRIVLAHLFVNIVNFVYPICSCKKETELPRIKFILNFCKGQIVYTIGCACVATVNMPLRSGSDKVIVATCIIIVSYSVISMMKTINGLGHLIIAVQHSFSPMYDMFLFIFLLFLMFLCAFITMKDPERSHYYEFLYLYRALFLGDDDGEMGVSGFDIAKEQTLDFNVEMYKGGGDPWLLNASLILMLLATLIFSVVLLNLIVGMYTKYYEEMQPFAHLLFQQRRAKHCVFFMLRPSLPLKLLDDWGMKPYQAALGGALLLGLSCLFNMTSIQDPQPSSSAYHRRVNNSSSSDSVLRFLDVAAVLGALGLTSGVLLIQASLLLRTQHADGSSRYLWVSARSDYNETKYRADVDHAINTLRTELSEANEERKKWASDAMRDLRTLAVATEKTQRELEEVKFAVISAFERFGQNDGGGDNGCHLPCPGLMKRPLTSMRSVGAVYSYNPTQSTESSAFR